MYVRCDESSLYFPVRYVHSPDGELLCGSVREIIKTMHTGFSAYTYCILYLPLILGRKTRRYDLALEKFM